MDEEYKTIYISSRKWQPVEFCAEVNCPYCGYEDIVYSNDTSDEIENECPNCEKKYKIFSN